MLHLYSIMVNITDKFNAIKLFETFAGDVLNAKVL